MSLSRKKRCTTQAKDSKDDVDITPDNDFCFSTGDVRILVKHKGENIEGRVSSSALCLASPVWEKFLFPPWEAEEPADGIDEIDCTGDDSEALLILLSIAHLQFQNVPGFLPYKKLLQVAVLCDQYDCVTLVRPWLSTSLWLAGEEQEAFATGQRQWLFIAWVFGRESVFEKLAVHMVKAISVRDEQTWKGMTPMPDGIIESILFYRKILIRNLLRIPYSMLEEYEILHREDRLYSLYPKRSICTQWHSAEACDALVYGSLVLGLMNAGLSPRGSAENITMSVENLRDNLLKIKIKHYPNQQELYSAASVHDTCGGIDFSEKIEKVLGPVLNPVLESHRVHMKAQKALLSS